MAHPRLIFGIVGFAALGLVLVLWPSGSTSINPRTQTHGKTNRYSDRNDRAKPLPEYRDVRIQRIVSDDRRIYGAPDYEPFISSANRSTEAVALVALLQRDECSDFVRELEARSNEPLACRVLCEFTHTPGERLFWANKLVTLDPTNGIGYLYKARALAELGHHTGSLAEAEKAIQRDRFDTYDSKMMKGVVDHYTLLPEDEQIRFAMGTLDSFVGTFARKTCAAVNESITETENTDRIYEYLDISTQIANLLRESSGSSTAEQVELALRIEDYRLARKINSTLPKSGVASPGNERTLKANMQEAADAITSDLDLWLNYDENETNNAVQTWFESWR